MIDINWMAPIGGTAEVLACVPGLKANTLAQWQARDKVSRRGAGHGRATTWHAHDVLEIATMHELSRFGVMLDKGIYVWAALRGVMLSRQAASPRALAEPCLLFTLDEKGRAVVRVFDEAADEDSANGSALGRADAPTVGLLFRAGRIMESVAARIAIVAPGAVRSHGAK